MVRKIIFRLLIAFGILLACVVMYFGGSTLYWLPYSGNSEIHILETPDSLNQLWSHPELKNKVVLVDVWGTRCGPCIDEFSYKTPVQDAFKNNPDVAFLYLAVPYTQKTAGLDFKMDKAKWKQYIDRYDLKGYHVFLGHLFEDMWKYLEGPKEWGETGYKYAIPRYFIMDKQGNLAEASTYRPSQADSLILTMNTILAGK